jgi:hypothetical protein
LNGSPVDHETTAPPGGPAAIVGAEHPIRAAVGDRNSQIAARHAGEQFVAGDT